MPDTVSRMKVQAMAFNTSQWGEMTNTMSNITTPLFSQPPQNTTSTHHNYRWLAMKTHLQVWRTMIRPTNVHGAHYQDWQTATRAHHHHQQVPTSRINEWPWVPTTTNSHGAIGPSFNKWPQVPTMLSELPIASTMIPQSAPILYSRFLQAAPHIPHISRHDEIPIQMRMPAQTWRWTKHEPQPKHEYPTTSTLVMWATIQGPAIHYQCGEQELSKQERACSLDRVVQDHHLEISKGLLKGSGGVSRSFLSAST